MEEKEKLQTTITEQLPSWKLRVAYFYTEHQAMIKKALLFFLFFADVIIVFLLGSILINYQTGAVKEEDTLRRLNMNLISHNTVTQSKPQELNILETLSIPTSNSNYNLLAVVKNTNPDWAIKELEYTFSIDGQELDKRTTFILPKSEKYLMYFNAQQAEDAQLKILNTQWQRVEDYSLLSYQDSIKLLKSSYTPNPSSKLSGEVELTISNNSPYSWWEIGLPIILYNQASKPIGINYLVINKLMTQEKRELSVGWHEPVNQRVGQVGVYPEINLLDESVVIDPDSPIGSPPGLD